MDVRRALPSIRIPTLVIHRVGDLCEKVEGGRYLASNIPGAKLVEAPGDDHLAWIGPQDEVLDPVEAFLTDLQSVPIPDRVLATGEVLVSSTVKDLVAGSGIRFEDRGVHGLKNIPGQWHLFAVSRGGAHHFSRQDTQAGTFLLPVREATAKKLVEATRPGPVADSGQRLSRAAS